MPRMFRWIALAMAAAGSAHSYTFFVHYFTRSAPWTAIIEKFDLATLQDKTVPFLISDQQPTLASGDTVAAVNSQIRLAARAWNDVDTSDIRVGFGGHFSPGVRHAGPVIEVVFGDVPPGLIAATSATVATEAQASSTPGAPSFVPIIKSTVLLNQDLSRSPSWSEAFFLTVTHELGHALGLQHSFTSSVMATEVTRATTKARPLALDDTVGLSLLYPVRSGIPGAGSIAGRVTVAGEGANLASVVALSPDGAAISAVTNPDGTYRIDGVPTGTYYVYAHPLPPKIGGETNAGGILPPTIATGATVPAVGPFETTFYPNARTVDRASAVFVSGLVDGINFAAARRTSQLLYGVAAYSFPGQVAVRPAYLSQLSPSLFAVLSGYGLTSRATVAAVGTSMAVIGVKPYERDPRFVQLDFQFNFAPTEGARHLVFSSDGDTYVLPAAVRVARGAPPSIGFVQAAADRSVTVIGSNFTPDTQILFDGVPAAIRQVNDGAGSIVVVPPVAPTGHRAAVVALNRDGQSSLFNQGTPASYDYESTGDWTFSIAPSQLSAGFEGMVEITGANAAFAAGAQVSFGSATIQARRTWVTGTNRLLANILIASNTPPGPVTVTVANGLRTSVLPFGFTVGPQNARALQLRGSAVDATTGAIDVVPGAVATVRLVAPAETQAASLVVSVNDRAASVTGWSGGTLNFRVPVGLVAGAGVLKVSVNGETAQLAMGIDLTPPTIIAVAAAGTRIDAQRPARGGETLLVTLAGAPVEVSDIVASRVLVQVGGIPQSVLATATDRAGGLQVLFHLDESAAPGNQQLVVALDGRQSAAFLLPVRGN